MCPVKQRFSEAPASTSTGEAPGQDELKSGLVDCLER